MSDNGKISVSTENLYIDRPIRGYDEVKEGDYVVLKISDTGIGINSEDIERIFEPFYNKKIDVKEQREIVSGMLIKLGYTVTTVPKGEKTIEYMKVNSANLLILDMIMKPGIDGFDTYKEILKLHPEQKVIIASGFSETDRCL